MSASMVLLTAVAIIVDSATRVAAAAQGQPAPAQAADSVAVDPVVDKILTRLENRQVHDLRAELTWKLTYMIEEEDESDTKTGEIWFMEFDPVPKFVVHFKKKITGNRKHDLDEKHMFDGRWYVELQSKTKTVTRRELRREGDRSNPYKVGEGPFPLPFGQKKADILREFEVSWMAATASDPVETDHLRLVPRAGTRTAERYQTVDFWVAREGHVAGLPTQVLAAKKDGTGKVNSLLTITFEDVRLNSGFSPSVFKIETPSGYEEYVERLEAAVAPATSETTQPVSP